jgi:hypothetical protein
MARMGATDKETKQLMLTLDFFAEVKGRRVVYDIINGTVTLM